MLNLKFLDMLELKKLYENIKNYGFDCFREPNPSLWTNIQKAFWTLVHGFICDEYTSRAASLTYYTVTSIVPFMALLLCMLPMKNFDALENLLSHAFPMSENFASRVFNSFENYSGMVDPSLSPWVALCTLVVMIWSTYSLFYNVVHTLNTTIWKFEDRDISDRLVFYGCSMFALILLACVLIPFIKTFEAFSVVFFYAIAFCASFLMYKYFPSGKKNGTEADGKKQVKPEIKGSFYGALIFVVLLMFLSFVTHLLSELILASYVRSYGKTFYVFFLMLAWIWAFYIILLSCAKIGQFIDNPTQNDPNKEEEKKKGFLERLSARVISWINPFGKKKENNNESIE